MRNDAQGRNEMTANDSIFIGGKEIETYAENDEVTICSSERKYFLSMIRLMFTSKTDEGMIELDKLSGYLFDGGCRFVGGETK